MVFLCNIRLLAEGKGTNKAANVVNNCRPVYTKIIKADGKNLLKKNHSKFLTPKVETDQLAQIAYCMLSTHQDSSGIRCILQQITPARALQSQGM